MVGIGGSGMAGLARLLRDRGVLISASEKADDPATRTRVERLRAAGCQVTIGHRAENVLPDTSLLVRSLAIPDDNAEIARAIASGVPVQSYVTALAQQMEGRRAVAIAGTHGKTTTSAMVVHGLVHAGRDPSYVVGGDLVGAPAGSGGAGADFVAEACEYRESFLRLPRDVGVILNVEPDHLDWFGSEAAVQDAFHRFAAGVSDGGVCILSQAASVVLADLETRARVVVVGTGDDPRVTLRGKIESGGDGFPAFSVPADRVLVELSVLGGQAASNGLMAFAVLRELGLTAQEAKEGLESFCGVHRRMEVIAAGRPTLVSDYAHHPTELRAVGAAARARWPDRRLVAVFQPHQASRTRSFLEGFADALCGFDKVLVADIYAARDTDLTLAAVSSRDVAQLASSRGCDAISSGDLIATLRALRSLMRPDDVILLLGAGDIDGLRHELANDLSDA